MPDGDSSPLRFRASSVSFIPTHLPLDSVPPFLTPSAVQSLLLLSNSLTCVPLFISP